MNAHDTTLHLWFKPHEGIMRKSDMDVANAYGKRFYPRAITEVAEKLREMASKLTQFNGGGFEYQMRHYTLNHNKRYVIEESLRDETSDDGFTVSIQNTNTVERKLFIKAFEDEQKTDKSQLTPVASVITYLQDSVENEAHRWDNTKLHNGQSAHAVLAELIKFLVAIKNKVKVYEFNFNDTSKGRELSISLVCPGWPSYYTRIDWIIV